MGYIKPATIKSQIETNNCLDLIHQNAENVSCHLDVIADEIINYAHTGKLDELAILAIFSSLTLTRTIMEGISELAEKAKLDIEIHE